MVASTNFTSTVTKLKGLQAGNYVKEQILSSFVRLIATTPDLQTYSVQKLYASLKSDITQEGLTLAAAWVIGEFGDSLVRGAQYEEEELVQEVKESDIVDLFATILSSSYATQVVSEYVVTALVKLTTRLSEPPQIDRIRRLLLSHSADLSVEIQQRAVEYGNLFGYDQIRRGVLEKMPPPEIREEQRVLGEAAPKKKSTAAGKKKEITKQTEQDMLLDLMGGSDLPTADLSATINGSQNADILADILSGGGSTNASTNGKPASKVAQQSKPAPSAILDLFDSGSASVPPAEQKPLTTRAPPANSGSSYEAYNKNNLVITLQPQRTPEGAVQVLARLRNTSSLESMSGVGLQVAVPKSQRLQLFAISSSDLDAGQEATQGMKIVGSGSVSSRA